MHRPAPMRMRMAPATLGGVMRSSRSLLAMTRLKMSSVVKTWVGL